MKVRHASSLVTLIIVLHALPVAAQDYPSKPVRLIVNTAAGGLMDVAARVTADHLGKALGQRFIIENRPGSGGNIGTDAVAKAEPDGTRSGRFSLAMLRSIRTSIRICRLIRSWTSLRWRRSRAPPF
jgi:tripartite-type tricarboxylate transporter receptor subunit TctC